MLKLRRTYSVYSTSHFSKVDQGEIRENCSEILMGMDCCVYSLLADLGIYSLERCIRYSCSAEMRSEQKANEDKHHKEVQDRSNNEANIGPRFLQMKIFNS